MPLSLTGQKIMRAMMKQYGAQKGKRVFYAMENEGKLTSKAFAGSKKRRKTRRAKRRK